MTIERRVGIGHDSHRFSKGRRLVLGGVEIPHELGLAGYSDADVLIHAVIDALLGAAGLGDIGRHFPDSDPRYRDADSLELLGRVVEMLDGAGWRALNVDTIVIAERPEIAPFGADMVGRLAPVLGIGHELVNVKATTGEGMGFVGHGEGIAAWAIAQIERRATGAGD